MTESDLILTIWLIASIAFATILALAGICWHMANDAAEMLAELEASQLQNIRDARVIESLNDALSRANGREYAASFEGDDSQ